MASIPTLTWTDSFASNRKPFLTDLRESLDSIVNQMNDNGDDLEQLALDCFPSSYTFDRDGVKNLTMSLYDVTTAVDSYTGGDFTITTAGAWTDLDLTNASIAVTPEIAGDFRVTFQFAVECVSSNATNEADVRFRLTDGTTASTFTPRVKLVTGASGTTTVVPVSLSYVYDAWTAAAKTVRVQYYITTRTAMAIKVYANTNDPLTMDVEKT